MSSRKILIGIPMRRMDDVECLRELLKWTWEDEGKEEIRYKLATPYGIDLARSQLISQAKTWGADILVMADSDISPAVPWRTALSFVGQAFSRGFGAVISPTISSDQKLLLHPVEGVYSSPHDIHDGLSEIGWGGLGLAFFDGEMLGDLKVLSRQLTINGDPEGEPLYCIYSPQEGEDMSLLRNVRESTGRKVGTDTRLVTEHWKLKRQRSWPGAETAQAIIRRSRGE